MTNCQSSSHTTFEGSSGGTSDGHSVRLTDPNTPLARFIKLRDHIRSDAKGQFVFWRAFSPPRDMALSVFEISGLDDLEVERLGDDTVSTDDLPHLGFGAILVGVIIRNGLVADRDDSPPRHTSISGWPPKGEIKKVAMRLAEAAGFVPRSSRFVPRTP